MTFLSSTRAAGSFGEAGDETREKHEAILEMRYPYYREVVQAAENAAGGPAPSRTGGGAPCLPRAFCDSRRPDPGFLTSPVRSWSSSSC